MPKKKVEPDVVGEIPEAVAPNTPAEMPNDTEGLTSVAQDEDVNIIAVDPDPIAPTSGNGYDLETPLELPAEAIPTKASARKRAPRKQVPPADIPAPLSEDEGIPYGEEMDEDDMISPEEQARRAFYGLDFREIDRGLSPEQQQEWNSIYASYRGHSSISGTVVGIDRHTISVMDKVTGKRRKEEMFCAIVIPFRVRVIVPETEMWAKGEERPGFVLRNIVGSKVDVVITHVDREGGFAIGSRRMAMGGRRYYFSTQPSMNRLGSRIKCNVLAVGARRCLVNCHGFDINLTQREMRYSAIADLRTEYHPGDELDCIVKRYDKQEGKLMISVKETQPNPYEGAQIRHPITSKRQCVISGKYAGGVFCNLPDGAVVLCAYASHYEDSQFDIGDKVIVVIQFYDNAKQQIYGKIVAKW